MLTLMRRAIIPMVAALFLCAGAAHAQLTVLQGGPWTPGHFPVYSGQQGSFQPVIVDSGIGGNNNPVFGPPSSTVGDLACYANIFGTLLQDPGLSIPTASLLGGVAPSGGNCGSFTSISIANTLGLVSNILSCTTATISQLGCAKPDNATIGISVGILSVIGSGVTGVLCANVTNAGCVNAPNVWQDTQSDKFQTLTISGGTFTPAAASGNDVSITLVHASCPCTIANWSGTPVAATHGVIEIIQSSTGSDTIGTWGSNYVTSGGTAGIALSSGANDKDYISYVINPAGQTVLSYPVLNAVH